MPALSVRASHSSPQIKGQRKEVLSAAEAAYGVEDEDKDTRKLALARAAAAPPVPVVRPGAAASACRTHPRVR